MEKLLWIAAVIGSLAVSSMSLRGPVPPDTPPTPPALPRPPTADEMSDLRSLAARMTAEVAAARARHGAPIPADRLEGEVAGLPVLPDGLPDNPLVPGVGGVLTDCRSGPTQEAAPDWRYCPETGLFTPTVPL